MATAIFRICQEALTNVMRHAGASRIDILLEEEAERLVLVVKDNGRGISPEQLRNGESLGIVGMRERALALGGRVTVTGSPEGTTVFAFIPLPQQGGT